MGTYVHQMQREVQILLDAYIARGIVGVSLALAFLDGELFG